MCIPSLCSSAQRAEHQGVFRMALWPKSRWKNRGDVTPITVTERHAPKSFEVSATFRAKLALTCFWSGEKITLANSKNWRRERDSNPRWAFDPYALSRGAPSTTRPSLRNAIFPVWPRKRARNRAARQRRAANHTERDWRGKAGVRLAPGLLVFVVTVVGLVIAVGTVAVAVAICVGVSESLFLALDALVDFLAMHGDRFRRVHADANLVAFHSEDP